MFKLSPDMPKYKTVLDMQKSSLIFLFSLFHYPVLYIFSITNIWIHIFVDFHQLGPLGRVGLVVAMSVCLSTCLSPFHVLDFEAYLAYLVGSGLKSLHKKRFFVPILSYKTWWKPRFPMD